MPRLTASRSRRQFLAGAAGATAALLLDPRDVIARSSRPEAGIVRPVRSMYGTSPATHLAWVWQFHHDGHREQIRDVLAAHGLGIVLKTHDGTEWMSTYDPSPDAVSGPEQLFRLASFFESGGVPFHCWCVVHGTDPAAEARLANEVLNAGARSLALDLEAHRGFWRGTPANAERYGEELRRVHPSSTLVTSVDARPWEIDRVPLTEFASFTDALAPQVYWGAFGTPANLVKFQRAGDDPGPSGMTQRFAIDSAVRALSRFGLPVAPIGDGTVADSGAWREFVDGSYERHAEAVSVWRFGVTAPGVWELLRDTPPRVLTYTIAAGDTLGKLAAQWGTTAQAIADANGIANPNVIRVGQQLRLPRGVQARPGASRPALTSNGSAPAPGAGGGGAYIVEPGDSLWDLARAWGTTPDAIAQVNGIADPAFIRIGTELRRP